MKIICLGDSITEGYGLKKTEAWPHLLEKKIGIEVVNCGISGDTTAGMLARFYPDVVSRKPTHVIITGGTNDSVWNISRKYIQANFQAMTRQAKYHGIIPIIGTPLPISVEDVSEEWGPRSLFEKCSVKIKELALSLIAQAEADEFPCLDFYNLFLDESGMPLSKLFLDGLHPTGEGHLLMAKLAAGTLKKISG